MRFELNFFFFYLKYFVKCYDIKDFYLLCVMLGREIE